jgi:hypothetical protein
MLKIALYLGLLAPTLVSGDSVSTCEELGWLSYDYMGDTTAVCGGSDISLGGCSGTVNWADAANFCESAGARLCTVEELIADETRLTGCEYDRKLIWSSTECDGGYSVAAGSTLSTKTPSCKDPSNDDTMRARCCADYGPVTVSMSTCTDLGWSNAAKFGDASVCGESDLNLGGCSSDVTQSEARAFCESAGARMCTADELLADETRGTGCKHDNKMIWSSTTCDGGYSVVTGSSTRINEKRTPRCEDPESSYKLKARCCADTDAVPVPSPTIATSVSSCDDLGWTNADAFGSTLVCGESDSGLGGCSAHLSWADAVTFCSDAGARLCRADELAADEARRTGCDLDNQLLWTDDSCPGGHFIQLGSTTVGVLSAGQKDTPQCENVDELHKARCCADVF